jgi:hypothetical protein
MKRERWGLPPWAGRTPPLGVLLPPIYWRVELLSLSCSFSPLGLSSRCSTVTSHGLGEALLKLFLHHHAVVLEVPVDPLLPLPSWSEGTEVFVKPYV